MRLLTSSAPACAACRLGTMLRAPAFHARRLRVLLLAPVFAMVFYFALCASLKGIEWTLPVDVLLGRASKAAEVIFYNVRLPRTTTAAVVGAALALAGAVMQNVLRNPLASASTLGVSQGASFGAALAITFFHAGIGTDGNLGAALSITSPAVVTAFAFLFGSVCGAVILALSIAARVSSATMILSGVALGAMFSGGTAIIQYFADDIKVASIVYWTFGDLGRTGWTQIGALTAALLAAFAYFYANAWNYNALANGTHTAKSLGVPVRVVLIAGMLAACLLSSLAVAFVGTIGFVGLIGPHLARRLTGANHRTLLIASPVCGAILLMGAEVLSRFVVPPAVLPIGAITSFLGAPVFLFMIFKAEGMTK